MKKHKINNVPQLEHIDRISANELLLASRSSLPFIHDISLHRNGIFPSKIEHFFDDMSRCHLEAFSRSDFIQSYFQTSDILFFQYSNISEFLSDITNEIKLFDILYKYYSFCEKVEFLCEYCEIETNTDNPFMNSALDINKVLSQIPADNNPIYSLSHTFDHILLLNERLPIAQQKANGYITDYIQHAIEISPKPYANDIDHRKMTNFKQHLTIPKPLKDILFVISKDKIMINKTITAKLLQQRSLDFFTINRHILEDYRKYQLSQFEKTEHT